VNRRVELVNIDMRRLKSVVLATSNAGLASALGSINAFHVLINILTTYLLVLPALINVEMAIVHYLNLRQDMNVMMEILMTTMVAIANAN
jgi:hypothetical protein